MNTSRNALLSGHCTPDAAALAAADVRPLLESLHDWKASDAAITRRFVFDDFHQTMAFVNAVAWIAHREDHHPDLDVGYDHCTVSWSTHSAGGVTRNDFICAARVEALVDA